MVLRVPQLNHMFVVTGKKEKSGKRRLLSWHYIFCNKILWSSFFKKIFKVKSAEERGHKLVGLGVGVHNTEPGEEDEGRHPAGSRSHWQSDRWRGLAWVCLRVQANASGGLGDGGFTCPTHVPTGRAHPPPLHPSPPQSRQRPDPTHPRHTHTKPNHQSPSPHAAPNSFFYSVAGFNLVSAAPLMLVSVGGCVAA